MRPKCEIKFECSVCKINSFTHVKLLFASAGLCESSISLTTETSNRWCDKSSYFANPARCELSKTSIARLKQINLYLWPKFLS